MMKTKNLSQKELMLETIYEAMRVSQGDVLNIDDPNARFWALVRRLRLDSQNIPERTSDE